MNDKTCLKHAQSTNASPRCSPRRLRGPEHILIEVRRQVERALPRLESALVHTRYEVSRRIDKCNACLRVALRKEELEARIEEVPSRECVTSAAVGSIDAG
jgi:hypothetical protein